MIIFFHTACNSGNLGNSGWYPRCKNILCIPTELLCDYIVLFGGCKEVYVEEEGGGHVIVVAPDHESGEELLESGALIIYI